MKLPAVVVFLLIMTLPSTAQNWVDSWLQRVSQTQAEQPQWISPVVTATPLLKQSYRFDIVDQVNSDGYSQLNLGSGKGLELIPTHNTELIISPPPYLSHQNPKTKDGFGDMSFLLKYRLRTRREKHGDYAVSAFLAGSIPTGSHRNGSASAIVTPTIAAGKGFGRFSMQSTLSATLPVDHASIIGHVIQFNNAFQYNVHRYLWPEVEINSSFFKDGPNDGRKQAFLTPGMMVGRIPFHNRFGITVGAGFQIAVTSFPTYNHALITSIHLPF